MVYPDNTRITYSPNAFGQPTEIGPYVSLINYYPNGALANWSDEFGQAHDQYLQNDRQMTNSLELFYFHQPIVQLNYIYDGDDNITSIQDLKTPNNTMQFTYNSMNWLTGGTGPWGAASISYDANGNIISKNIGSTQLSYSYDGARNILNSVSGTSNETFSYDAYGDVTSVNNNEFDYDGQQHLIHEKGTNPQNQPYETSYMYDANGHRSVIIPSTGDRSFEVHNQQSQRLWQYDQNTQMATDYIYLAGHEILEMKHLANQAPAAPDMTYMHDDLLGSPILTTDATGYIIWQQQYAPYGTELNRINRPNHSTSYTGKPKDQDTGLSYYGARYYSPDLGRFMSIDPESVNPENIMSFNRYAYANNNPYLYKDPIGNFPDPIEAVAGAILGGIAGYSQTESFSGMVVGAAIGSATAIGTSVIGSYAVATAETAGTLAKIGTSVAANTTFSTISISEMNEINTGQLHPLDAVMSAEQSLAIKWLR
jgi:RHS repeat-associated protein